ncbi:MAG: hypothetical protein DCC55_05175 [Chloroflexi bacterium]|nr:MAG: hypothetical protein DCC55_05175 [Chloroflexota bacterium]
MNRPRIILFLLLVFIVTVFTASYVWQATNRATQAAIYEPPPLPSPAADSGKPQVEAKQPARLFSIELGDLEGRGFVKVAPLDAPNEQSITTPLRCMRMHFAAGVGICLHELVGSWLTPVVSVTIFNERFQPIFSQQVDGYTSRARVSPDGRYAAYTVFVSGHSYNDSNFSTATHIWEIATGQDLGNLETFEVWRDGRVVSEIDFNFWGVTFASDSNRFYATLSTGGVPSLVEGDIAARRVTVLRDWIECPSLSPDNRRIAFKKARGQGEWQLTVLDLATMQETPLAESRSVDDQVEWLDDATILYQQMEYDSSRNAWISVLSIPADGSGAPTVFVSRVGSPAVVHSY